MTGRWLGSLGVALGFWAHGADAGDWRPAGSPAPSRQVIAATGTGAASQPPAVTLGRPTVTLGQPVAVGSSEPSLRAVAYSSSQPIVRMQAADPPPVPPPGVPMIPAGPEGGYNPASVAPPPPVPPPPETGWFGRMGGWCKDICSGGDPCRHWFQSDHCFDNFISPVTLPRLFEDPRSLTEIRPIFIYQKIPSGTVPDGGNIEFFGMQARLAITERLSIVMSQFGGLAIQNDILGDNTGFAELDIGPKFTFLRSEQSGSLGAIGLNFEIPVGSSKVFSNTGSLSLRPYITMAQNFGRTSYGSFNVVGTFAYSFALDDERSDHLYGGLHWDFDVANAHKFYPLIELNWLHYTANGNQRPINFEGGDLTNLGATNVKGNNIITLAAGARYKFSECAQVGAAVELPVTGRKDLYDFRFTLDLIFRY